MRRLALLLPFCLALSLPAQAADARQPIVLKADEVATIVSAMRGELEAVGQIISGIAANDMKAVAAAARSQGINGDSSVSMALRMKMPAEFRSMGHPNHMAFDDLARDAESLGDPNQAMKQLGNILNTCNACHQTFRLVAKK